MPPKDFPDIHEILDQIFSAAEEIREAVAQEMGFNKEGGPKVHWFEYRDFYPGYSYPPLNVYMSADRSMVFQFALAGFSERDVQLEFKGDYLVFSAQAPQFNEPEEGVRYFKRRLKLKAIPEQKYYVPADKYKQDATTAIMKNAILTVTVPAKDGGTEPAGRPINIVKESPEAS